MLKTSVWRYPPLIGSSPVQTALVMAFAAYGSCTITELCELLELERTNITKRLRELEHKHIVTKRHWAGNAYIKYGATRSSDTWMSREYIWDLDRRHPLFRKLFTLGRRLRRSFPLPSTTRTYFRKYSRYRGPRGAQFQLSSDEYYVFGQDPKGWLLMFLARTEKGVPIETAGKMLGRGAATIQSTVRLWEQWGIVRSERRSTERLLSLDKSFCAYNVLRRLAREIDRATGGEFKALSHLRKIGLIRKRLTSPEFKRRRREKLKAPIPKMGLPANKPKSIE